MYGDPYDRMTVQEQRGREFVAELQSEIKEAREMLFALVHLGWKVRKLDYGAGIQGWLWTGPCGVEYHEVGSWDEIPSWPAEARHSIANPI